MTTSIKYSIFFVLLILVIVVYSETTYSIELHSIEEKEPYPALYLQDNETIVIGCNDTDHVYSPKLVHRLFNGSKILIKEKMYTNVFDAEHLNGDTLQCVGKSNETGEIMSGIVVLLSYMNKAYKDWNNCNDENYCLNRAQCYRDPDDTDIRLCVCPPSMGGYQCERTAGMRGHAINHTLYRKITASVSKSLFIITVSIISSLLLIVAALAAYFKYKHLQESNLRKRMLCSICNVNRADHNHADHEAATEATQTNNAVIFKGDYITLPYIDANPN
uniref:EGF-like domain-containing protein n=1 Tax=Panagrellus redivivus TaxID=6233 RepID=A0A7E4WC85_PANRE